MPKTINRARVPHPPNAFIIYRSQMQCTLPNETRRNQSEVSKIMGKMWRDELPEIKAYFEECAALKKFEHEQAKPGYNYSPKNEVSKSPGPEAKKSVKHNGELQYMASHTTFSQHDDYKKYTMPTPAALLQAQKMAVQDPSVFRVLPGDYQPFYRYDAGVSYMVQPNSEYYPPYRYGSAVEFDEMGAYAVDPTTILTLATNETVMPTCVEHSKE